MKFRTDDYGQDHEGYSVGVYQGLNGKKKPTLGQLRKAIGKADAYYSSDSRPTYMMAKTVKTGAKKVNSRWDKSSFSEKYPIWCLWLVGGSDERVLIIPTLKRGLYVVVAEHFSTRKGAQAAITAVAKTI